MSTEATEKSLYSQYWSGLGIVLERALNLCHVQTFKYRSHREIIFLLQTYSVAPNPRFCSNNWDSGFVKAIQGITGLSTLISSPNHLLTSIFITIHFDIFQCFVEHASYTSMTIVLLCMVVNPFQITLFPFTVTMVMTVIPIQLRL